MADRVHAKQVTIKLFKNGWRSAQRKLQLVWIIQLHLALQITCKSIYGVKTSQCHLAQSKLFSLVLGFVFFWKFNLKFSLEYQDTSVYLSWNTNKPIIVPIDESNLYHKW